MINNEEQNLFSPVRFGPMSMSRKGVYTQIWEIPKGNSGILVLFLFYRNGELLI